MLPHWLKKWLNSTDSENSPHWKTDNSIYNFLLSHINENGSLSAEAENLPDEPGKHASLRFAPGLRDALLGIGAPDEKIIAQWVQLLKEVSLTGNEEAKFRFYNAVTAEEDVIGFIDEFISEIVKERLPVEPYLFHYAIELATKTNHRNSVKIGLALVGLCQNPSVLPELKVLGLHEEFALYASIAVSGLSLNVEEDLWNMAKKLHGWGRIRIVGMLAEMELSEQVKEWMVKEGYRNSILNEYLACTCAIKGELHLKLEAGKISKDLFQSASEILEALFDEYSPGETIDDYPFAASAIPHFLRHAHMHDTNIAFFNLLHSIQNYLQSLPYDDQALKNTGWNRESVNDCMRNIHNLLTGRDWKKQAEEALKSKDPNIYHYGKAAAKKLGIDLWDNVWNRLKENPLSGTAWYDATHYAQPEHADEVIQFAIQNLPLKKLGTGPDVSLGMGEDFQLHQSLEFITLFLEGHPGKGKEILFTALQSPVIRIRNAALKVLETWKHSLPIAEFISGLKQLKTSEPQEDLKEKIDKLLQS